MRFARKLNLKGKNKTRCCGEIFLTKEKAEKALAEKEKQNEQCI